LLDIKNTTELKTQLEASIPVLAKEQHFENIPAQGDNQPELGTSLTHTPVEKTETKA